MSSNGIAITKQLVSNEQQQVRKLVIAAAMQEQSVNFLIQIAA